MTKQGMCTLWYLQHNKNIINPYRLTVTVANAAISRGQPIIEFTKWKPHVRISRAWQLKIENITAAISAFSPCCQARTSDSSLLVPTCKLEPSKIDLKVSSIPSETPLIDLLECT